MKILLLLTLSFNLFAQPLDPVLSKQYENKMKQEEQLYNIVEKCNYFLKHKDLSYKQRIKLKKYRKYRLAQYKKVQIERKTIEDKLLIFNRYRHSK